MKFNKNNSNYAQIRQLIESSVVKNPIKKSLFNKNLRLKKILIDKEINQLNKSDSFVVKRNNKVGIIFISEKPWESSIFNKKIAAISGIYINKFDAGLINELLDFVIDWVNKNNVDLISYRTENAVFDIEATTKIRELLIKRGFYLVETYLSFMRDLKNIDKIIIDNSLFDIKLLDQIESDKNSLIVKQIVNIAKKSFSLDRFHIDHFFARNLADKSRAEWIANIAKGRGRIIYATDVSSDKVVGFIGFKGSNIKNGGKNIRYNTIKLIAVDKKYQGRAVGSHLIKEYLNLLRKSDVVLSIVGTQAINIPSIRLYEKCGYRIINCNYSYHWNNKKT